MIYPFSCRSCEYSEDREFEVTDLPESIKCPKCEEGQMRQDFSRKRFTVTIPPHMRAGGITPVNYGNDKGVDVNNILGSRGYI